MSALADRLKRTLLGAARLASAFSYPTSWEKLAIDENRSLWAAYTPDYRAEPSLAGETTADLAIIGGGFTGVSTAYHFSRRFPEKRVVLLEAKTLGTGASGRNDGMMLNWIYGVGRIDETMRWRIYRATSAAIAGIEAIIRDHALPDSYRRNGTLSVFTTTESAAEGHAAAERLQVLGIDIRYLDADALRAKIGLENAYGALFDPSEGQLNGAQYVRLLKPVLQAQGVAVYENTPVLKVEEGKTIRLTTPNGSVRAAAIVLATHAYTGKLGYFRKGFFPLHSHVFATAPATDDQLAALGRGATAGFAAMQATLDGYLPGAGALPISHRWTDTLAITLRRNCAMGIRGERRNVYYALGYSGHDVTAANMAGQVLTDLYSGADAPWRGLPFVDVDFTPIPLEPFCWIGYQIFTRVLGRSPRIEE